jgi:hypothetical protein
MEEQRSISAVRYNKAKDRTNNAIKEHETRSEISCKKKYTRAYPKVSGLAAWSENCKWYSSLRLDAVVSLFY